MTISKLKSGRYRAQVWHDGSWVSVPKIIGGAASYRTKTEAKDAKAEARRRLKIADRNDTTVAQWRDRWRSDPLFARPSESTNVHLTERTKAFADKYGQMKMRLVGDDVVAEWLSGGKRNATVPALRAMFNDARSAKAGRIVKSNPFAGLGLEQSKGNKEKQPPTEEQAWTLIQHARDLTPPSFAAYLEVACFSAARPGELDALRWSKVDFAGDEILVDEQWNAKTRKFTLPKHRHVHTVTLTPPARDCLLRLPRDTDAPWCFATLRGHHYTPSSRNHHWNRVRAAAGLGNVTLYMATRHYAGWYMLNVLELPPHVIAEQLGHQDGGALVRKLYGHPDGKISRRKIHEAYSRVGQVRPLKIVRKDTA